jgi:hypothetical protein
MPKPTPEEVLKAIEESEVDDEVERVLAMTPEQRRAELEAAGFDLKEVHAKADALHERFVGAAAKEKAQQIEKDARVRSLRPPRSRPRPVVLLVAAMAVAAVAGGVLYAVLTKPPAPGPAPSTPPVPSSAPPQPSETPELLAATDLRRRAFDACNRNQWKECLAGLDEAKRLDPAGDSAPAVRVARQVAEEALGEKLK